MYKVTPKEIKDEIINRIKTEGLTVPTAASQYGFSPKTIYAWLSSGTTDVNILEINKLKRENDDLKRIIGELTLASNRTQKKK